MLPRILFPSLLWFSQLPNNCWATPQLYQVTDPVTHAEGPTWDHRRDILYFVDIPEGDIYSYDYQSGDINFVHLNGAVTPVIPSKSNPEMLMVGLNRSVIALKWDGKSENNHQMRHLVTVSKQFPTSRFNDGKADKQGRLWFGTMGFESDGKVLPNQGLLYKISRDNLLHPAVMIAPVNISNGLAWNSANDKLFYIDTPTRQIVQYDYSDMQGDIKNGHVCFDLAHYPSIKGNPDGMTIDKDDHLWVALFGGGAVIQVDPKNGTVLQFVPIPARDVTSVIWGGPDFDILFVTTSRINLSEEERKKEPMAGSVFAINGLDTYGLPVFNADIIDME